MGVAWRPRDSGGAKLGLETPGGAVRDEVAELIIVDDDIGLREEMAAYLGSHGYRVHQVGDVPGLERGLRDCSVQLIILDVMLPGEGGLSACRRLAERDAPPILMLSAMGEDIDRIVGLELGADDYLAKPVNPRELLARVRAMLRRRNSSQGPASGDYVFADFRLYTTRRQLKAPNGSVIMLTPTEFSLLKVFLDHPQQVLTRDQLLDYARGEDADVFDRVIDVQVSRLRRKLHGQIAGEIIRTYRGAGYMLDGPVVRI